MISNDSTLEEGQTTMLACLGYNYVQPNLAVSWVRDGTPVMNSTLISSYQMDTLLGNLIFQGAFVEICSIDMDSAGNYTCIVTDGEDTMMSTVEVNVLRKDLIFKF